MPSAAASIRRTTGYDYRRALDRTIDVLVTEHRPSRLHAAREGFVLTNADIMNRPPPHSVRVRDRRGRPRIRDTSWDREGAQARPATARFRALRARRQARRPKRPPAVTPAARVSAPGRGRPAP